MGKPEIENWIAENQITAEYQHVPVVPDWDKDPHPMVKWLVTIRKSGREIIRTNYSYGLGHLPYKRINPRRLVMCDAGAYEAFLRDGKFEGVKAPLPDLVSVLYCLSHDSDVINYPTFEVWADEFDLNPDSRKDESIYKECLTTALALKCGLGDDAMRVLAIACEDY